MGRVRLLRTARESWQQTATAISAALPGSQLSLAETGYCQGDQKDTSDAVASRTSVVTSD